MKEKGYSSGYTLQLHVIYSYKILIKLKEKNKDTFNPIKKKTVFWLFLNIPNTISLQCMEKFDF